MPAAQDVIARFHQQVAAFIDQHRLLPVGADVLAAVSGGGDSVALLYALLELSGQEGRGYRLHVAHVDHGLRPDSAEDARWVEDLSRALGLPFELGKLDVTTLAADSGESLETAGRTGRYEFLRATAEKCGCTHIVTAHHADDNVETLLHRILRGTGLEGLRGIRPSRPIAPGGPLLVRPMLSVHRAEVEAYLQARRLQCRFDTTNYDVSITRNRIRHELLPRLREQYNPQVDRALLRLATTAEWAQQWLDELGAETLAPLIIDRSDRHLALSATGLKRKSPLAASQAIREALIELGAPLRAIGLEHVRAVLRLLEERNANRRLELPAGLRARREYEKLILELGESGVPVASAQQHELAVPGRTALPDGQAVLVETNAGGWAEFQRFQSQKSEVEEMVDADKLALPLLARHWQEGDRFWPLGSEGHTKLSDLFVNLKVPLRERQEAWIICDQLGPVWVAPYRIDNRVRVTQGTKRVAIVRLRKPSA